MKRILRTPLWTVVLLLLIHFQGVAQENVVTGTVVSATDDTPLPGVTVTLKGKTRGTVTDAEGHYSILAASSDVLVFTFIGMETQELAVGNSSTINVKLQESMESLQEVVVVG